MTYLIPKYTEQMRRGIDLCLNEALVVPALALIYSGIDVLGFLGSTEPWATRATFIPWADKYLAEFLKKRGIGGIDLFSARCGVLHTGQARSNMVENGDAPELWYRFQGNHINFITNTVQPAVLIDVEELVAAFDGGISQFFSDADANPSIGAVAEEKANRFFRRGLLLGPDGLEGLP
jgi:hypothetical protein